MRVVTRRGSLPQGAPTSPHLANLAFSSVDVKLEGLGRELEMRYTRYADDLTFSGDDLDARLVERVDGILEPSGYRLAPQKTHIMGRHRQQRVTGLVVNERVRLPRELRRWVRAVQHDVKLHGLEAAVDRSGSLSHSRLRGYLALLGMVEPELLVHELAELQAALAEPRRNEPSRGTTEMVRQRPVR